MDKIKLNHHKRIAFISEVVNNSKRMNQRCNIFYMKQKTRSISHFVPIHNT